jgi:transcriptional regulator with XRE-family HTH domain
MIGSIADVILCDTSIMNKPHYPTWSDWLRSRMREQQVSVSELSRASGVPEPTLRSYRAGQRKPTSTQKRSAIAQALRLPFESQEETEASLQAALQTRIQRKDFYQELDSDGAVLRTMTHVYGRSPTGKICSLTASSIVSFG